MRIALHTGSKLLTCSRCRLERFTHSSLFYYTISKREEWMKLDWTSRSAVSSLTVRAVVIPAVGEGVVAIYMQTIRNSQVIS